MLQLDLLENMKEIITKNYVYNTFKNIRQFYSLK